MHRRHQGLRSQGLRGSFVRDSNSRVQHLINYQTYRASTTMMPFSNAVYGERTDESLCALCERLKVGTDCSHDPRVESLESSKSRMAWKAISLEHFATTAPVVDGAMLASGPWENKMRWQQQHRLTEEQITVDFPVSTRWSLAYTVSTVDADCSVRFQNPRVSCTV